MKGASGSDLVKKIETSFLLFDNKIVRLETRDAVEIEGTDALSIAAACAKLLTTLSAEQSKDGPLCCYCQRIFSSQRQLQCPELRKKIWFLH